MPSHPVPDAFAMMHEHGGAPWNWSQWQEMTGITHGLFPDDDNNLPSGWTRANALDVKTYFIEYNKLATEASKLKFSKKTKLPGREFWFAYINKMWKRWHIHDLVVQGLRKYGIHPLNIMKAMNSFEHWPSAEHYVPKALDAIGLMLFGEDVYIDSDLELLHPYMRKPIAHIVQRSWSAIRLKNKKDTQNIGKLKDDAVKAIQEMEEGKPTRTKITRAMGTVKRWKALVEVYGTQEDSAEVNAMLGRIEKALALLGEQTPKLETSKDKKLHDKNYKDLATEGEIEELTLLYDEYFQPGQLEDDEPVFTEDSYRAPELADAFGSDELGMEEEARLTPEAMAKALGFVNAFPHQFNEYRHKTGLNAWDQPTTFQVSEGKLPDSLRPLSLHWHQLAGVHSAARNWFTSDPTTSMRGFLISDEVGLGKTALSLAIIAFINQVKTLQDRGRGLPPVMKGKPYLGLKEIDSLPHLIICPGTLRAQWIAEIKTLFKPRSVDILVYDGGKDFWGQGGSFLASKQSAHNKIIIMTHSLLFNEMKRNHEREQKNQRPWEYPRPKRCLEGTIFGQKFLTVVIDEAHQMRNLGNKHCATIRILEQATARLVLTATPLLTAPRDIAAMGRLVGVPHFHSDESLSDERDYNSVIRRKKKEGLPIRRVQVEAVRRLQKYFNGRILRRTTDSRDWMGRTLLNLPPHKDIVGILQLTERETEIIQARAELAKAWQVSVVSANETGKFQTKKFYLEYRTAVGYAKEDPDVPNPKFNTLAEWEPVKSTKMDVCARICQHYLTSDDIGDVTFEDGKPVFDASMSKEIGNNSLAARRILIYAEFPSMTPLLRNVLSLYGVQSLAFDGKMKFDKRDKIIQQFHESGQPRVLIFSSVGSAGLNLSVADVVIFFDQPWSAQDERQIRGRAHRQPQQKTVKAIHLLASDSTDLLMNDMARGKRDMFDAFLNKTLGQELRDLLSGKAIEEDIVDYVDDDETEEPPSNEKQHQDSEPDESQAARRSEGRKKNTDTGKTMRSRGNKNSQRRSVQTVEPKDQALVADKAKEKSPTRSVPTVQPTAPNDHIPHNGLLEFKDDAPIADEAKETSSICSVLMVQSTVRDDPEGAISHDDLLEFKDDAPVADGAQETPPAVILSTDRGDSEGTIPPDELTESSEPKDMPNETQPQQENEMVSEVYLNNDDQEGESGNQSLSSLLDYPSSPIKIDSPCDKSEPSQTDTDMASFLGTCTIDKAEGQVPGPEDRNFRSKSERRRTRDKKRRYISRAGGESSDDLVVLPPSKNLGSPPTSAGLGFPPSERIHAPPNKRIRFSDEYSEGMSPIIAGKSKKLDSIAAQSRPTKPGGIKPTTHEGKKIAATALRNKKREESTFAAQPPNQPKIHNLFKRLVPEATPPSHRQASRLEGEMPSSSSLASVRKRK